MDTKRGSQVLNSSSLSLGRRHGLLDTSFCFGIWNPSIGFCNSSYCTVYRNMFGEDLWRFSEVKTLGWGPVCEPVVISIFCHYSKSINNKFPQSYFHWFILFFFSSVQFSSVAQSCLTLRPHESQHARPPCPSPAPGVYSNSCPFLEDLKKEYSFLPLNFFCFLSLLFPALSLLKRGLWQWQSVPSSLGTENRKRKSSNLWGWGYVKKYGWEN